MSNTSHTNQPGYFQIYIDQVTEKNLATAFSRQSEIIKDFLPTISEAQSTHAYAPGKWTIKELFQHLIDAERVFTYRAVCFARNEQATLPGFDEDDYAAASNANARSWESITAEFVAVRRSSLFLYDSFTPEMLARVGKASSNTYSVEALGFILLGHFNHHKKIIEERYL
jgi:hypothetical protein